MNFIRKSLKLLVKLQQMFRIAEIELGMEKMIGITLKTGVRVQSAILHVCPIIIPLKYKADCISAYMYTGFQLQGCMKLLKA